MAWIDDIDDIIDDLIPTGPGDYITDSETRQILKDAFRVVYDNYPTPTNFVIYEQVRVAALSNISTLSGLQTINGISLANNDRIILTAQTSTQQNGIWQVKTGSWIRPSDFDTSAEVKFGICLSKEGDSKPYMGWGIQPAPPFTLGTSAITIVEALDLSMEVYADLPDRGYFDLNLTADTWVELPIFGDFKRYVPTFLELDGANNEEAISIISWRYNSTSQKMEAYTEVSWAGKMYAIGITSI